MCTFTSVVGATINCLVTGQTGSWQHFGSHKKMAMRLVSIFAFKGKDGELGGRGGGREREGGGV